MQSTTSAAIRAAKAAEDTLSHMRDTAERQLRAFVFGKGFQVAISVWHDAIDEYAVFVKWENVGNTPATDVHNTVSQCTFPMNENREPSFPGRPRGVTTVLGPHATFESGFIRIPLETMIKKWQQEIEIYVWSRIEYRDIFDPSIIHHHEQCACVEVVHEPSTLPPPNHPSYIRFSIYGPKNSSS